MNKKIEIKGDIKKLSFEEALSELEGIVERLERGDIDLEDSISIYERGVALKAHCESKLSNALLHLIFYRFPKKTLVFDQENFQFYQKLAEENF